MPRANTRSILDWRGMTILSRRRYRETKKSAKGQNKLLNSPKPNIESVASLNEEVRDIQSVHHTDIEIAPDSDHKQNLALHIAC